ncbi:MAG: hypothetical protein ACLFO5_07715 [Opitutales bacterium]
MITTEISLHALALEEPLNATGAVIVLTELILPRPAITRKSALKTLRLTRGKRSLAKAPFYETGQLKEKVDGRFGLKVSVTRPGTLSNEALDLLRSVLAAGVETAGDSLASLNNIPLPTLKGLIKTPFQELADRVEDDALEFFAEGGLDLDTEEGIPAQVAIPLRLTRMVRHHDLPPGPKAREKRRQDTKFHKKGTPAGKIELRMTSG